MLGWTNFIESVFSPVGTTYELQAPVGYSVVEEYDQDKDDALLMEEIWGVGATVYKNIIDITALYFNGVLLDTDQLYDHMMIDLGKNLFQVVKLLAWYGPKMIQNPHVSWKIKAKKTACAASFLVLFWLWSRELSKQRQHKNMYKREIFDESPYRHQSVRMTSSFNGMLPH